VVVAVVVLMVLMVVGVWWLMWEDEAKQGLRPPVVEREIPGDGEKPRVVDAGRGAAAETPREAVVHAKDEGAEKVVAATKAPEEAKPEGRRQLTVDGEEIPEELLNRTAPPSGEFEVVEYSTTVTGVVRDAAGNPVARAETWADSVSVGVGRVSRNLGTSRFVYQSNQGAGSLMPSASAKSGEDGRYRLEILATVRKSETIGLISLSFSVHAKTDSLMPMTSRTVTVRGAHPAVQVPAEFSGMDLTVAARGGSVAGKVVWANSGEVCPDAGVALTRDDWGSLPPVGKVDAWSFTGHTLPSTVPVVRAENGGAFKFEKVPDGEYICWAVEPGRTHSQWRYLYENPPEGTRQAARVTVRSGLAVTGVELALIRLPSLTFRTEPVLDVVPGVKLLTRSAKDTPSAIVGPAESKWSPQRSPSGIYVINGILPSHKYLCLIVPGYVRVEALITHDDGRDIDLGTIMLDVGGVIDGKVIDETGRPMPGAAVVAEADMGISDLMRRARGSETFTTVSANDGTFRLTGMDIRVRHTLSAALEGYQEGKALVTPNPLSSPATVVLTIHRATAVVFGRIEIADSTALTPGNSRVVPGMPSGKGRFVLAVDAASDSARYLHPQGGTIQNNAHRIDIPVGADWTFRKELKPGKYKVAFSHGSETKVLEVEVVAGQEAEVVFRIGERSGITGKVIGTNGLPLQGAKVVVYGPQEHVGMFVTVIDAGSEAASAISDKDGVFSFEGLKAGRYLVWLPDHPTLQHHPNTEAGRRQQANLQGGNRAEVEIDLSKPPVGAVVYLSVKLNGVPQLNCEPRFAINGDQRGNTHPGFVLLPDKTLLAVGVPPGSHRATVSISVPSVRSGSVHGVVPIEVPQSAKEVRIDHDVLTSRLSGTVEVPKDAVLPLSEITVMPYRIMGPGGENAGTATPLLTLDGQWAFSLAHVEHGWYRIEVTARGYQPSVAEVEVTKDTHVTLRLGDLAATVRVEFGGFVPGLSPELLEQVRARTNEMDFQVVNTEGKSALLKQNVRGERLDLKPLLFSTPVEIVGVAAGQVSMTILHPMAEPMVANCFTVSGQTVTVRVTFVLAPKLTLTSPASDSPKDNRELIQVTVRREPTSGRITHVTMKRQPDGSYVGSEYVPALGTLYLTHSSFTVSPETATITLTSGTNVTHAIRLMPK